MLRLTLAQMRRSVGRLAAAAVAIAIGTGFVAATLLASNAMTRAVYDAMSAELADADLVVTVRLTDTDVASIRAIDGVAAADGRPTTYLRVETTGGRSSYEPVTTTASDRRLQSERPAEGELPVGAGQIALAADSAERLGVTAGDLVEVVREVSVARFESSDEAEEPTATSVEWVELRSTLQVVGLIEESTGFLAAFGTSAVVSPEDFAAWEEEQGTEPGAQETLVLLDDGAELASVRSAVAEAVAPALREAGLDPEASVLTQDDYAAQRTAQVTGDSEMLTVFVLGFASIALLVAGLVIANTFQVLVAQRTHTLALLRCVGASKGQLRRSVITEALLLGAAASVLGVLLGAAMVQATLVVLGRVAPGYTLPSAIEPTPAVVLVPLAVGVTVTVLAALAPARAATAVAPLAALRPADAPTLAGRLGKVRITVAVLLVLAGCALLATALTMDGDVVQALGLGVLGGAVSFLGVLLSAVLWVPWVVAGIGKLVAPLGRAPARLAAANTGRNPRRTAATATALLIGVTLVALMSTGAASVRATLDAELDGRYAVDVVVGQGSSWSAGDAAAAGTPITSAQHETVAGTDGVATVAEVTTTAVTLTGADGLDLRTTASGLTAEAAAVVRDQAALVGLSDATVLVPSAYGVADGTAVTVTGAADGGATVTLSAVSFDGLGVADALVTAQTLAAVAPSAMTDQLWVELDDGASAYDVVQDLQIRLTEISGQDGAVLLVGSAVERSAYEQVIDTVLAVVVGLLAVAVVIALVGVTNTLSLSVIERRRESATLRALGLTRGQLRGTLAVEGMIIAGVGAVLGCLLGVLYGFAGTLVVLTGVSGTVLVVPWDHLAVVLLGAMAAGVLASVLPGRHAANTPPVAALAEE